MAKSITYIGLDVHKDTIAVALAEAGLRAPARKDPEYAAALKALTVKLALTGRDLLFCYEAGPCVGRGGSIIDSAEARRADQN